MESAMVNGTRYIVLKFASIFFLLLKYTLSQSTSELQFDHKSSLIAPHGYKQYRTYPVTS